MSFLPKICRQSWAISFPRETIYKISVAFDFCKAKLLNYFMEREIRVCMFLAMYSYSSFHVIFLLVEGEIRVCMFLATYSCPSFHVGFIFNGLKIIPRGVMVVRLVYPLTGLTDLL